MPALDQLQGNLFKIYAEKLNSVFAGHVADVNIFIKEQRALGLSNEEIMARLEADAESMSGIYGDLKSAIAGDMQYDVSMMFQMSSNDFNEGDAEKLYEWQLDPNAEHCDSCLYQEGRGQLPISEFPVPGNQETNGATNCEEYCKCTLVEA